MNNEFKLYHPIVNFAYFAFAIGFSCIFMHPCCLLISLISSAAYSVMLKGAKSFKTHITYILPSIAVMALLNPAFNHEGVTILTYLPSGNPLTLESIVYGIAAAVMAVSVVCRFLSACEILTSDKTVYVTGRFFPTLALMLSMTLRFVPRFKRQFSEVSDAHRSLGIQDNGGSVRHIKNAVRIMSAMLTWSLEDAVDTADSMKARGYGIKKRTSFSVFRFEFRDAAALCAIIALSVYIIIGALLGCIECSYFPSQVVADITPFSASIMFAYALLSFMPIIIEITEIIKWNALKSKI